MQQCRRAIVASLIVCALVGAPMALAQPSGAIQSGVAATQPWAAFVVNTGTRTLQTALSSGDFSTCTGTFVAPEWVLTAAHCVDQEVNGKEILAYANMFVYQDPLVQNGHPPTTGGIAATPIRYSTYKPDVLNPDSGDVALLHLVTPEASPGVLPIAPPSPSYDPDLSGPLAAYGYGLTAPNQLLTGPLQETRPNSYTRSGCDVATVVCSFSRNLNPGFSTVLHGDSGGPWVAGTGSSAPAHGQTTTPFVFGVADTINSTSAFAADLTNRTLHNWITNNAHTILAANGACATECVVNNNVYVHDGFGQAISDSAVVTCLENAGVSHVQGATSVEVAEIPTVNVLPISGMPRRCLAGSYSGHDSQNGNPINLFADNTGMKVQDLSFPTLNATCTPGGGVLGAPIFVSSASIASDGTFQQAVTYQGVDSAASTATYASSVGGVADLVGGWLAFVGLAISTIKTATLTCTTSGLTWNVERDIQPTQTTAPPPSGSYTGTATGAGNPMNLFVNSTGTALQDVSYSIGGANCSPNGFGAPAPVYLASVTIANDGSFVGASSRTGIYAGYPATWNVLFFGHVHGLGAQSKERLAGEYAATLDYTTPTGAVHCTSDVHAWQLTRDTQPTQTTAPPPSGSYTGYAFGIGNPISMQVNGTSLSASWSIGLPGVTCNPGGVGESAPLNISSTTIAEDGSFTSSTTGNGTLGAYSATWSYDFEGHVHGIGADGKERLAGQMTLTIDLTSTTKSLHCSGNVDGWTAEQT